MERFANLKYWESIIAYIIVGLYIVGSIIFFILINYGTPLQILKRWMTKRKEKKNGSD